MHLLDANGAWVEGLLDQTVVPGSRRVHVQRQWALCSASSQYFVRPRDPRMVLAYLRAFGPKRVWRKVRSRQQETTRNDAWLSVGAGWIDGDRSRPVLFVATGAPRGVERWVIPEVLLRPVSDRPEAEGIRAAMGEPPLHAAVPRAGADAGAQALGAHAHAELVALAGWQPEEGTEPVLTDGTWSALASMATTGSSALSGAWSVAPPRPPASDVRERVERTGTGPGTPPYHVFGYGQYAKVNATANLNERLHVAGVHEINPVQLGPVSGDDGPSLDTSPLPRADEQITNAVVAGYHHTHVPTAVALMEQGARHIIVEKPIAVNAAQVTELLDAMARHPEARVHCAFQRSYSPFNPLLRKDLGDGPTSMAATVYEVPLPDRHWYRWPVVGNAVISNGCHWIDYFLHVNGHTEVADLGATVLHDQTLLSMELTNGATASISLRHKGSPRLGVRDLIQFWTDDATATIEDNATYRAERGHWSTRSRKVHRSRATEEMYKEFGRRIASDLPGDDPRAIAVSATAVVELAALVDRARADRADIDPR